jgi:hypothetical protein
MTTPSADFFLSYTHADRFWAGGLASWLEEAGYKTILQANDFPPGSNFVLEMHAAAERAKRTLAVLSPDYLLSRFPQPEWAAAFSQDPTGSSRKLVGVRIRECEPPGLLRSIVYIDLCSMPEEAAKAKFLAGIKSAVEGISFPQEPTTKKSRIPKHSGPKGVKQNIVGNDNVQVAGDYVRTDRHVVRPRIEINESHITEETAFILQQLITKLVEREIASGTPRKQAYAQWQQALKNKFRVVSYLRIPRDQSDQAISWLKQQKAINNSKIRRNNPALFRNEHLAGIHAKYKALGMSKPSLYAFATIRLGLLKPLTSLTQLGERNLAKLNRLLSSEVRKKGKT